MTSISHNLSGKISPILVSILRQVEQATLARGIAFFIVGATARDLVLQHGHNIPVHRATLDLDLGVEVAGWDEFRRLKEALIATGRFVAAREPQRLSYERFVVDIIPYGAVSTDERTIHWPPDQQVMMNIMGFQEAYSSGLTIRLSEEPRLDVRVPTVAGMALMKLISWNDDYPHRPKDASDLLFLMEKYTEAGNDDRLFDDEPQLLEAEGFDTTLAGIRLLGRDMAAMANQTTVTAVQAILRQETDEQQRYRLVLDMVRESRLTDRIDEVMMKLKKLASGFDEARGGENK